MDYSLTQHVRERYAERIMGRDNKADIQSFIAQHEVKIYDDIEAMIKHGTVIYEGPQVRSNNKSPCKYILRNDWLVVVDTQNKKVVTLYKIDLGAGLEFNQIYINTMLSKLDDAKKKASEKTGVLKQIEQSYQEAIEENEILIVDYKRKIKSLEDQNISLKNLLQEEKNNIAIAEEEIRDIISIMTTGTKF
jgi:hypothetical protein